MEESRVKANPVENQQQTNADAMRLKAKENHEK